MLSACRDVNYVNILKSLWIHSRQFSIYLLDWIEMKFSSSLIRLNRICTFNIEVWTLLLQKFSISIKWLWQKREHIFFWYQWNLQERFHACKTLSLPILMEIGTKFFVKGMSTWKTVIALQITQFKSKRSKIRPVVGFAWQGQILKNQLNRSVTGNFIPLWSWGR